MGNCLAIFHSPLSIFHQKNMLRLILGVVVGFVAWSILWVGSNEVLVTMSPDWWGAHQTAFERAWTNKEAFTADATIMIVNLLRSFAISIISGFLAAVVANESKRTTLVLGVLLLLFGIFVQVSAWSLIPIWYHFLFLFMLIPMTIAGGKLKSSS
jgi:hypothetical protein